MEYKKHLMQVHLSVLLFGISGLFAKLLDLPSGVIVFGRSVCSALFLLVVMVVLKEGIRLSDRRDYKWLVGAGILLAIHWTTFLQSIQLSTVAIGTITFSTFPLFVTFLEPYFFKEKLTKQAVITAGVMLLGVLLMVQSFELENEMTLGIVVGMISSASYAVLSLMNRRLSGSYSGRTISFYEQGVAALVLVPMLFIYAPTFTMKDIGLLLLLGVVFTAVAHTLFINGIRVVKVQTAAIISSLESVYGIVAALLLLGEVPSIRELLGGFIILGVVIFSSRMQRDAEVRSQEIDS